MPSSRFRLLVPAFAAVAFVTPRAVRAQTWIHSWTECTPSASFHSCHSVSIETAAVMSGDTRTGTTISIALHNLQGQGYAADNTTSSALVEALFIAPGLPLNYFFSYSGVPGEPSGGASGIPTWVGSAGVSGGDGYAAVGGSESGGYKGLGGCGSLGARIPYDGFTCLANSAFTFSFTLENDVVDANQFAAVYINAYGVSLQGDCISDPSQYPYGFPACDVQAESLTEVTPEPITMVLLGTGLLGLAGVRVRRRKRPLG